MPISKSSTKSESAPSQLEAIELNTLKKASCNDVESPHRYKCVYNFFRSHLPSVEQTGAFTKVASMFATCLTGSGGTIFGPFILFMGIATASTALSVTGAGLLIAGIASLVLLNYIIKNKSDKKEDENQLAQSNEDMPCYNAP